MEISYDNLKAEYLDSLTILDRECFSIPWSRNLFENELLSENAYYVLALHGNRVVGYGGINKVLDEGNITNIAVHPQYRNCGIASNILHALIDYSKNSGLSVVMLELRESNNKAFNLYVKYGFQIVGKRKNYYRNG